MTYERVFRLKAIGKFWFLELSLYMKPLLISLDANKTDSTFTFFHKSSMIYLEKLCLSSLRGYFFHFFAWLGLKGQPTSLKPYTFGDREFEYCTRHLRWPYLSLIDINKLNYLYTVCRLKAANSENTICHRSAAKENIPKRKPHRRLRL